MMLSAVLIFLLRRVSALASTLVVYRLSGMKVGQVAPLPIDSVPPSSFDGVAGPQTSHAEAMLDMNIGCSLDPRGSAAIR